MFQLVVDILVVSIAAYFLARWAFWKGPQITQEWRNK